MKNLVLKLGLISIIICMALPLEAQSAATKTSPGFDMTGFPQWTKDLRRGGIVAFGSFSFALFTTTFITECVRWNTEANMDWSEEGRRYAPWPFKSTGAIEMGSKEREMTFITAAGLSVAIALTDFIIVQIKRAKERRRAESLLPGTATIDRRPYPETEQENEDAAGGNVTDNSPSDEAAPGALNSATD